MISGSPDIRRRFFDIACSLLSRTYYDDLRKYNRTLQQRNSQIKLDIQNNKNERFLWNEVLVNLAERLIKKRKDIICLLSKKVEKKILSIMKDSQSFCIEYKNPFHEQDDIRSAMIKKLLNQKKSEDVFKTTVCGPHRDEFIFNLNNKNMKFYSSQGEKRIASVLFKTSLIEFIAEEKGNFPIILFDDILLEIDRYYMESVLMSLSDKNQLFFTATEIPEIDYFSRAEKSFFFDVSKKSGVSNNV